MQAGLLTNIPIPSSHTAQHYVVDAQRAFEFNQICQSDTHNRWDGNHGHESRFAGKCRRPRWSLRSPRLHPMHTGPANNAYTGLREVFGSFKLFCLALPGYVLHTLFCGPCTFYRLDTLLTTEPNLR